MSSERTILIVSPAGARQNNGNWQTAKRWSHFLRGAHPVTVAAGWSADQPAPDLLIALHARRSADALAAFARHHPDRPSILVLTGTDLYRDIADDAQAQASLTYASALVLLQPAGLEQLAPAWRDKAQVIYQSAAALRPDRAPHRWLDFCMIGHLRAEKDPLTFMRAAALLQSPRVRLVHIGGALEAALGAAAESSAAHHPNYVWLGELPRARARQRLKRSRALVIASRMEGGANVIIEAVTSGVPVLASHIGGNRGMLGDDYAGYFPTGDAAALARLIERCANDDAFHAALMAQCAARAPLFAPQAERAAVLKLVDNLLHARGAT